MPARFGPNFSCGIMQRWRQYRCINESIRQGFGDNAMTVHLQVNGFYCPAVRQCDNTGIGLLLNAERLDVEDTKDRGKSCLPPSDWYDLFRPRRYSSHCQPANTCDLQPSNEPLGRVSPPVLIRCFDRSLNCHCKGIVCCSDRSIHRKIKDCLIVRVGLEHLCGSASTKNIGTPTNFAVYEMAARCFKIGFGDRRCVEAKSPRNLAMRRQTITNLQLACFDCMFDSVSQSDVTRSCRWKCGDPGHLCMPDNLRIVQDNNDRHRYWKQVLHSWNDRTRGILQ